MNSHLPHVSIATNTSLHLPAATTSGMSAPCHVVLPTERVRPRQPHVDGFALTGQDAAQRDIHRELSTSETRQLLGQDFDAPVVCIAHADVHVSKESVEANPGPCLATNSRHHALNGAGSCLDSPSACTRCAVTTLWVKRCSATCTRRLGNGEWQLEPPQHDYPEQVRRDRVFRRNGSIGQSCTCIGT